MYETIKNFLGDGGRCLLIEDGKPVGVVLTVEEYEKLKENKKSEILKSDINTNDNLPPQTPPYQGGDKGEVVTHPVGAAIVKEFDFSGASADIDEINFADAGDVTLEDLGLDPDIQLPQDF